MRSLPREQVGTEACLNTVTAHQVYCKERERKVRCICNFANAQLCDAARNLDVLALAVPQHPLDQLLAQRRKQVAAERPHKRELAETALERIRATLALKAVSEGRAPQPEQAAALAALTTAERGASACPYPPASDCVFASDPPGAFVQNRRSRSLLAKARATPCQCPSSRSAAE